MTTSSTEMLKRGRVTSLSFQQMMPSPFDIRPARAKQKELPENYRSSRLKNEQNQKNFFLI
jgi:hypothetical protein